MGEGGRCGCSDHDSIKRSTRNKYDEQWASQDERAAAERRKSLSMVADPLLSMVQPLRDKVVVDLGIGTGSLAFRAIELSPPKSMIGIDFSAAGLCVARGIARRPRFQGHDIELVRADLERIPLTNRSVDAVISQATINLLPDKCTALKEISRIARHGARVAISDAFRTSRPMQDESWEECIAGAVTVSEFSTMALNAGLIISGQLDLTQQVRQLVASRKWDWPEFVRHNMDYRAFLLLRS
ncbi:MAG: methyltransferase domain-containing protein [Thermoplasmata archaeon]|jgi:ubiquinone/menaquinone biosynthesis C-methylase UbiE|nr:methyltransferase domain-containing protein [Thermoplasmata archaeon]